MPPVTDSCRTARRHRLRHCCTLGVLLILAGGCAVHPHTTAEQQSSYDAQARRPLPLRLPAHAPSSESAPPPAMSPASFIAVHTAVVLNATGTDSITLQSWVRFPESTGDETEQRLHYTLAIPAGVILSQGAAAAVAPDGYFLTAEHNVDRPALVVIAPGRNARGQLGLTPRVPRIVARFPEVDLALLQVALPTPHHLEPRLEPLTPNDVLYASSWINAPAAGPFLRIEDQHVLTPPDGAALHARTLRVRLPSRPGDSGSPLIDEIGRLCGIATASRLNRFRLNSKPTTVAAMIEAPDLRRLIAADRARAAPPAVP